MSNYISCGIFKNSFWYLFFSMLFKLLNDLLYGFNHNKTFKEVKLFDDKIQNSLSKHIILHSTFNYFGTFIIAFIYYRFGPDETIPLEKEKESKKTKIAGKITLIHHNGVKKFSSKKSYIFFLIIIFLWIFQEQLVTSFMHCLKDLDFWMIEILIISLISSKMFNLPIYKHQWLAIFLNIIPCILKITAISLTFYDNSEDRNNYEGNLPKLYRLQKIYIPLGIIAFLILVIIRSYVNSKVKWYMDLKYISLRKFLAIYGLMGSLICSFICSVTTYKECIIIIYKLKESRIGLHNYICAVKENKTNHLKEYLTYEYLDNFKIYFKAFKHKEILKEIIVIIFGILTFFFSKFFTLLSIKHLTPVHIVFTTPIYFLFKKSCLIIYTVFSEESVFIVNNKIKKEKFFLDISGDILSVFGFLIYLEIIIFNCKGLNYNININIIKRGICDTNGYNEESIESLYENTEESDSNEFAELT